MDFELKEILLRRKSKVVLSFDNSDRIIFEDQNIIDDIIDGINNKYYMCDYFNGIDEIATNETTKINNKILLKVDFGKNLRSYCAEYYNGKEVDAYFDKDDENVDTLSQEKLAILKKGMLKLYRNEYEKRLNNFNLASTLNKNLESLGYCMDENLFLKVALLNEDQMTKLNEELIKSLKKFVGADVEYHPMYPNFPKQVMEMKQYELYINAMIHYWSGGKYIPVTEIEEREKEPIEVKLKYLSYGSENDIIELMKNLMNSAEALDPSSINDITVFFKKYPQFMETIPDTFVNKENLANITNLIMKNVKDFSVVEIAKRFSTTTDVLRLAAVMSEQSASLAGKIHFKSFSNKERRMIMDLLNKCSNRREDIFRHEAKWERVCERIHPEKFRKTHGALVDDLLGVYKFKRVAKRMKREIEFYKKIFAFMNSENTSSPSQEEIKNLLEIQKEIPKLRIPKHIGNNLNNIITTYTVSHQDPKNEDKFIVNREKIEERISNINKIIDDKNENIKQYKLENERYYTKVDKAMKNKEYGKAMELLAQRPGEFSRHLDELIIKSNNSDEVLRIFENIASKASVKVLLSVKGYFAKRNEKIDKRVFLIKGSESKMYLSTKEKVALEQSVCDRICRLCENALIQLFEGKPKLNNVYIEKGWEKLILPQDLRSTNSSKCTLSKGSRISLSYGQLSPEKYQTTVEKMKEKIIQMENDKNALVEEKNNLEKNIEATEKDEKLDEESDEIVINKEKVQKLTKQIEESEKKLEKQNKEMEELIKTPIGKKLNKVRCFIWWTNTKSGNRIDIDLSCQIFDDTYTSLETVSFSNLSSEKFQIYHSGDITDGGSVDGKGVAEFIDFDPSKIYENGGRYVVINVICYNGVNFVNIENCKFGWMEREDLKSNEIFEPSTVRQRIDLTTDNISTVPVVFDCKEKEFVWIDSNILSGKTRCTIQSGSKPINAMLYYYCNPMKENINNLINIHVKAREGTIVESEDDLKSGDVAFVLDNPYIKVEGVRYIVPTDLDVILSEFMTATAKIDEMEE